MCIDLNFVEWLKHNKLQAYQQALEDEGFEELESLALLNDEQLEDLSSAIQMKLGHKLKFHKVLKKAREKMNEQEAKQKTEKEERRRQTRRKKKKNNKKMKTEDLVESYLNAVVLILWCSL